MTTEVAQRGAMLVPTNMSEAIRLAEFMASAKLAPKHLAGSPADCLLVIEQSMRWGMSPFAVMSATGAYQGKLIYEGKLIAAAVETCGAIVGHFDHCFSGAGEGLTIDLWATRRGETTPKHLSLSVKAARTDNKVWTTQPEQQLVYAASRVWARRYTPAVILGVYSRDEMERGDIDDPTIIQGHAETVPDHPPEPRDYHITLPNGELYAAPGSEEWVTAWHQGLARLGTNKAKMRATYEANRRHLMNVSTFDPAAAKEVEELINLALKDPSE